jgi:hypothetical protein
MTEIITQTIRSYWEETYEMDAIFQFLIHKMAPADGSI